MALVGDAPALADDLEPPAAASAAPSSPEKTTEGLIDELFGRLAKTADEDEAAGVVSAIQQLWLRSGSDTSDLLMSRALTAFAAQNYALALQLLDTVIAIRPDWAEGWNKRATVRFYAGDTKGSAADVAETLQRNPRHIGALAGLGAIFEQAGQRENALQVYERALKLAPHYKPLSDSAERLRAELAGQSL